MNHGNKLIAVAAIALGMAFAPLPAAYAASDTPVKADNTKVNMRDRSAIEMTADRQGTSKPDREITRELRKALMADKGLSTYAHNIKIITKNGAVTLKGPVKSEQEHKAVLNTAMTVLGTGTAFTDEISVKR